MGAMHYGPRPVFNDDVSWEVHVLDRTIETPPETVTVTILERLREVRDFPSKEELMAQIGTDIEQVRAILGRS